MNKRLVNYIFRSRLLASPLFAQVMANKFKFILLSAISALVLSGSNVEAGGIGDIYAFYNSQNDFGTGLGVVDGTVFVIENTGTTDITNAVFNVGPGGGVSDSYKIGTIAAGKKAIIEPGVSNDGASGHTFFAVTGSATDESDSGFNGNDIQFQFTGKQSGMTVYSPIFTPAATVGKANDGSAIVNFLGGPNNADSPCNDCFGPKVVANLSATNIYSIDKAWITPTLLKTGNNINISAQISGNPNKIASVVFLLGTVEVATLTDPNGTGTWTGQYLVVGNPGYQAATKIHVKNANGQVIARWPGYTITP
jgi:hypothetical protein